MRHEAFLNECSVNAETGRSHYTHKNVFIVFVAGLPRKPKLPFADWYSTYARSFSKAAYSFPTRKNCALLPIVSFGNLYLRTNQLLYRRSKCLTRVTTVSKDFLYRTKIIQLAF